MDSDFLVIGSGLAGLTFALEAARAGSVLVVTKDRLPESATEYAQGGIASVWSPEDSFEVHSQDTMTADQLSDWANASWPVSKSSTGGRYPVVMREPATLRK